MAKKQIKKQDEAIALDVQLTKTEAFIEKNLKKILCVIGAVVVVVLAGFLWNNYKNGKEAEAQKAIAKSQQAFAQQQFEQALNGDGSQSAGFLRIIDEFGGTKTANLAKLYAAICYAKTDKFDEAVKMFEGYSQQDDQMISPASLAALGNCYIQQGKNDKGVDLLLKAAKTANNDAISPLCLLQAAQIYEADGKNDKAVELYKEIKDKYFRSSLAVDMDKYIERASK
ncbi:MAG: tetratricopeptide repeat protein [Bacteroidaceae bacterium]|jgi:predicted negative regulator of RcsB-dependent stress response|nr:tetratricopeptide repeat protein [Bacteroidaceae bacterium]